MITRNSPSKLLGIRLEIGKKYREEIEFAKNKNKLQTSYQNTINTNTHTHNIS